MKKPVIERLILFSGLLSIAVLLWTVLVPGFKNRPPKVADSSIAAELIAVNSGYKFTDGVRRRGWSTIHKLDVPTALRVEEALHRTANRTGIPVNYLAAYVVRESTGDPKAEFRNPAQWEAARDDRGRFAAADYGLVQISGRNLLAMFPGLAFEELKTKAEDVDFATRFLADQVASDIKWASDQDIDARVGVDQRVVTRAKNPFWLAVLAYNRGREGALSALSNPRACRHAELVIDAWARIDARRRAVATTDVRAAVFPALVEDDPLRLAIGDIRPDVESLQRLLNDRLSPSPLLTTDGNFGPATRDALTRFQKSRNLEPTGATDARTWEALMGSAQAIVQGNSKPLMMGTISPRVESLQRLLNDRLSPSPLLTTDGNFGPATRDALIRFQKSRGIAPTGAADAATLEALDMRVDAR